MMRKKKKRVAVTVKNPFREIALPFEGRRMLISTEDLTDDQSDAYQGGLCPLVENSESESSLPQEPDIIYRNFEKGLSKNAKGVNMFKDEQRRVIKGNASLVLDDDLSDNTEKPCNNVIGDNSYTHLPHTRVNHKKTDMTLEFFKIMQKINSRQKRNNSKQTINIKEPKRNEETMSQKVQRASHSQDNSFCWDTTNETTHRHGKHQDKNNTRLKPQAPKQSTGLDFTRHVPLKYSDKTENSMDRHEEQPVPCKSESCSKDGSSDEEPKTDKAIPYQIQMNVTPEGRTHRYLVRRVKHFMENDSSKYSYVIHVSGGSDGEQGGSETEVQKSTKKRRGDIARRDIFTKESPKADGSCENEDQSFECVSTEGNKSDINIMSDSFRCCRSEGKAEDALVPECPRRVDRIDNVPIDCSEESSRQRDKSKDKSVKTKVSKRLIDHLKKKESMKEERQTLSVLTLDNNDICETDAIHPVEDTSQNLLRTRHRKEKKKENCYHIKPDELNTVMPLTNMSEKAMHVREDSTTPDCGEVNNSDVLVDISTECNEKMKEVPSQTSEVFSADFASANLNENRKYVNDHPDSKLTTYQSVDCHGRHTETEDSESDTTTDPEAHEGEKGYSCYSQTNAHKKWKYDDPVTSTLEGKRTTGFRLDFAKYYKGSNAGKSHVEHCQLKKEDSVTQGSSQRVKKVPALFKGSLRADITDKHNLSAETRAETKSGNFSCSTEHLNQNHVGEYGPCARRETTHKYTKSPQHTTTSVKPMSHSGRKNKIFLESASNSNSQNITGTSLQETDNQDDRTFLQSIKSPISSHSPAMNIALQNENHSNRMKVNRESSLFPTGAVKRKRHRSKVPKFKHKSPEPDVTGITTFTELSKVLQDARANSIVRCTADKLHGGAPEGSDSISAIESCVNSTFMGEYLRCLWTNQFLCDVRVTVGDEEILVHKLVLAAYSSVFCPPTTRPEPTVSFQIEKSTPEAVRQLFSYMYTSNMALTDDILEPMINAAIVMGVQEVVDIVKGILSNPTMENVNLYTSIIKRVGLDISLLDQEKIYRHGFTDLKQNSVFLGICVDEFEGILMDPEVMVTNEAETVEMIISWIQYNYLQRIGFLDQLLRHVSFECIPPADLVALSEKYSHIFETNAGNSFLCQAFKYHALHSRLPCVPTEGTQHIDEMKPSDNISNISNISQESKRQASEDNQSPKEYLPEEGLTAIKTTLWGPQTPTEPDSFVPPGRTSDPTSATNNRSPPTATRSSSSTPAANNGTQSGTS